ncbi:MAG: hypothetical protein AAGC55_04625, partial [Myxococcota bacterium]
MVVEKSSNRLLLRAELSHSGSRIVTHTLAISESLVVVQTDEDAYIGDKVMVDFSFPGLVAPFSLETQVIAKQLSTHPGEPKGWTLGFVFYSEEEQAWVRNLLQRA